MESFAGAPETILGWITSVFGTNPSSDFVLLLLCGALVALISVWGRSLLGSLLISAYIAMTVLSLTPMLDWLQSGLKVPGTIWGYAGILLGITAVVFAVANYALADILADDESPLIASMVIGVAIIGMLVAYLFVILPENLISGFAPITRVLLTGGVAMLLWIIAPLILIGATRD